MKAWRSVTVQIISILTIFAFVQSAFARPQNFDGDTNVDTGRGIDDLTLFDASTGTFHIRKSSDGEIDQVTISDGSNPAGNVPAYLDRNGDGQTDPATFNRSTGTWAFSVGGTIENEQFSDGSPGNIPVPGKFNGNACDDLGVYNPLTKTWWTKDCVSGAVDALNDEEFGRYPIVGDFDGDGVDDLGTWEIDPTTGFGEWYLYESSTNQGRAVAPFGLPGDIPLAADFDGDGDAEPAVFRPFQLGSFTSLFIVLNPDDINNPWIFPWGLPGDFPNLLDTLGDGKGDLSIFRAALAAFFVRTSQVGLDWLNLVIATFQYANAALPIAPNQFISPAVPGDANRDGHSDFAVVTTAGAFNLWYWLLLDGNSIQYLFGLKDDTPLTGDLDGDKQIQPVAIRNNGGFLDWYARLVGGQEALLFSQFGLADDTPLLGDLDCDGKDEPIVVRALGGNLFWFWLNSSSLFADAFSWSWGLEGDTVFASDMNGDGCDELVVARALGGAMFWFGFSPRTARTTETSWGLPDDTPFPPADFTGDGAADPIVIREAGGQRTAYVRLADGTAKTFALGSQGTPAAGYFSGTKKAQMALYVSNGAFGTDTAIVWLLTDIAQTFALPQSPGSGTVVAPLVLQGTSGLGCRELKTFVRPELYKPFSDAVPGHGVVLFDDSVWSRASAVEFFDRDNNFIGIPIRRKCCPNGGRAHYWMPQPSVSLLPVAPITVRLTFTDGSNTCRIIPNPTRRYE